MIRFVAREGRMVGTVSYGEGRYVEVLYRGDFAASLRDVGTDQIGVTAPPAVVASQGGDLQAFLHALRQGILDPLEIAGFRADGSLVEVELKADNGTLTVGLDPAKAGMSGRLPSEPVAAFDRKTHGRLARYHSGFLEDMATTVKGEVTELLK